MLPYLWGLYQNITQQAVAISSGFKIFFIFADIGFINVWWNQHACKFIDLLLVLASSPCWDTAVKLSAQSPVASMPLSVLYKSNWLLFTPQTSGLEGYCRHGPGGRAGGRAAWRPGGRLPDLRNPYLCNRLTNFLHSKFCGIV